MSIFRASPREALEAFLRLRPLVRLERRARLLELKTPADFQNRSRRLRRRLLRRLDLAEDQGPAGSAELGLLVRRQLKQRAAPIRELLRAALVILSSGLVAVGLLIAAASAIFPAARAFFFPPNLAAHAAWQTSSAFPGTPASGIGTGSEWPLFFHTIEEKNASITITLQRPAVVRRVRIRNREDCCQERALPLDVEALGNGGSRLLCQRRAPFSTWTCNAGGVKTQRLRLRHPGLGMLHLAEIEVFE